MAIVEKKENRWDSLIAHVKVSCVRIKEIDERIDSLRKKIEVGQDDRKLAYYEYTCSEFRAEKNKIANNFIDTFKEIRDYNEELQENYERLQKSIEIQQIMNRYCARALKEYNHNPNLLKKRHAHSKMEEDFQKMLKEKDDIALKMEQTSPIVDTIKRLLTEIEQKHQMQDTKDKLLR